MPPMQCVEERVSLTKSPVCPQYSVEPHPSQELHRINCQQHIHAKSILRKSISNHFTHSFRYLLYTKYYHHHPSSCILLIHVGRSLFAKGHLMAMAWLLVISIASRFFVILLSFSKDAKATILDLFRMFAFYCIAFILLLCGP